MLIVKFKINMELENGKKIFSFNARFDHRSTLIKQQRNPATMTTSILISPANIKYTSYHK